MKTRINKLLSASVNSYHLRRLRQLQHWLIASWHCCKTFSLSYSWRVTTYVGKPSATGQPTRPTQPFILSG